MRYFIVKMASRLRALHKPAVEEDGTLMIPCERHPLVVVVAQDRQDRFTHIPSVQRIISPTSHEYGVTVLERRQTGWLCTYLYRGDVSIPEIGCRIAMTDLYD